MMMKKKKTMQTTTTTNTTSEQQNQQNHGRDEGEGEVMVVQNSDTMSFSSHISLSQEDQDMSTTSALSNFRAKEDEIQRRKMEVRDRVLSHLGRVQLETRRLSNIRQELEALADPMRKDVSSVRKKIDLVNKEIKALGHSCQKKEREYKEAVEAFNEKNKEKVELITRLMEMVSESEKLRMKKLEELSKNLEIN